MDIFNTDIKLWIALISAITALIIAIIQAVFRKRDGEAIEKLKAELACQRELQVEYVKTYLAFMVDGKESVIHAFKDYLKKVQIFRDKVQKVVDNPERFDTSVLKEELTGLSDEISLVFAQTHTEYNEDDYRIAHTLKNECKRLSDEVLNFHALEERTENSPETVSKRQLTVSTLQKKLRNSALSATQIFGVSLKDHVEMNKDIQSK